MKNIIVLALISLILQGCASFNVVPPSSPTHLKEHVYEGSYDRVWRSSIDWFASRNIIIDKIEKDSGLITAKYALNIADTDLDCGDIRSSGILNPLVLKQGYLNFSVRERDNKYSIVRVNFFGTYRLTGQDGWDGKNVVYELQCESTGAVEKDIFKYINVNLKDY